MLECWLYRVQGLVVAALEHGDGSACLREMRTGGWLEQQLLQPGQEEYQIRNQQVHTRAAELIAVLRLVFILAQ